MSLVRSTETRPQAVDEALPAGTCIDTYELRRVLGAGGFGIVYLAWDATLEREVALKEYLPTALATRGKGLDVVLRTGADAQTFETGLRSFVNEGRLLAQFDHPALVKVHRFWADHGTAYMVMPYYRGRTLRQVRQAMTLPPDEHTCRRLIHPLLSALEQLHGQNVFHRDVAPDNILIGDDDGAPVLLDFGAARRLLGGSTSVTAIVKPSFAPLEQYDGSGLRQGAWTDLYALGATCHYLLTGQSPVPAVSRVLGDELEPLALRGVAGCSTTFLRTIDWMLALRPEDRPQDVPSVRAALEGRRPAPTRAFVAPPPRVAARLSWPATARRQPAGEVYDTTQQMAQTTVVDPAAGRGAGRGSARAKERSPNRATPRGAAREPDAPRRRPALWAGAGVLLVGAMLAAFLAPSLRRAEAPAVAAAPAPADTPHVAAVAPMGATPTAAPVVATPANTAMPVVAAATPRANPPVKPSHVRAPRGPDGDDARAAPRRTAAAATTELCTDALPGLKLLCVKRECMRSAHRTHPACERLRQVEQDTQRHREQMRRTFP